MKRFLFKLICIVTSISILLIGCSNHNIEMTEESEKYLSAVEEMVDFYKENPYIFYNSNEEDWMASLEQLKSDIKNNKVAEDEIYYRMQELSASLNNGHTYCIKRDLQDEEVLPIRGVYCENGFYILFANNENRNLLGKELVEINGIEFEEVEERYSKIISAENDQWVKSKISMNLMTKSLLKYLNLWQDNNVITVKGLDGEIERVNIDVVSFDEVSKGMLDTNNYLAYNKAMQSIENSKPSDADNQYWYKLDKENRILYFQYNECYDIKDKNRILFKDLTGYPDFNNFIESFTKYADENKDSYDKIVVDVSNNTGGNPNHFDNLTIYNNKLFSSKKVYVIMTKNTFSAGVVAVNTLVEKYNAVMVGEETGGSIEMFGLEERLSSILDIEYISGWYKIDVKKAGKNSSYKLQGAIPDIEVKLSVEDLYNGNNPYYKAIIDN